jgi:hypothetical protein
MVKLDNDVKKTVKNIIQGYESRKKRIKNKKFSSFDLEAESIIEQSVCDLWSSVACNKTRKTMQNNTYTSITRNMPYEYFTNPMCGRRQFYEQRNMLITLVATRIGMAPLVTSGSE